MSRKQSPYHNPFDALEPRLLFANPTVIDLLALYTPGVASEQGGATVMQEVIREAVNTANLAFQNSLIPLVVRLVRVEAATANGSGDLAFDLNRLRTPSDGFFDNVQSLRNDYGADLVTLFTQGEPNVSGVGDLLDNLSNPNRDNLAYTVIGDNAFTPGDTTLAHELAHNLGAGHERGNVSDPAVGPFDYSYGHRLFVGPNAFRDIMAYAPGVPLPYFANPSVLYRGVPTGVPEGQSNAADIAKTLRNTAPVVAAYRNNVVADTAAPTASLYQTTLVGNVLTFTVRYRDDSAVDQSTIDNNDVRVTLPNGGVLRASRIGTNPENAFQRLATYQVVLPADRPATSSLVFNIQANQVRDVFGNAMASGALVSGALGDDTAASESLPYARDLGTLANPSTRFLSESLDANDRDDFYQFTLGARSTVSFNLAGLSADVNAYLVNDLNGNGRLDGAGEQGAFTFAPTATGDRSTSMTLDPGTYYLMVRLPADSFASSNYDLTVRTYTDVTPPTVAFVDAPDLTATGQTQYVFAVTFADDVELDSFNTATWAALELDVTYEFGGGGYVASPIAPAGSLNTDVSNAKTRTLYYRLPASEFALDRTTFGAADNGTYTLSLYFDGGGGPHVQDAAGNRITGPTTALASFRVAVPDPTPRPDTVAPRANLNELAPVVAGNATYTFSISYTDNRGIDVGSFGSNDVRVTGPNGFDQLATFVSFVPASHGGSVRTASYQISAPGGRWDATDDGLYILSVEPDSVGDATTNPRFVPAGILGTFSSNVGRVTLTGTGLSALGTVGLDSYDVYADANFAYLVRNGADLYQFPRSAFTKLNLSLGETADAASFLGGSFAGTLNVGTLSLTDTLYTLDASTTVAGLSLLGSSVLGLGTHSLVVNPAAAGGLNVVNDWINAGKIASSAVVSGQTRLVAVLRADNTILIKVGKLGDTNLDGLVDVDDYHRTDRGFLERRTRWQDGDFNGDGRVNLDDYAILDAAYLTPPPAPAAASGDGSGGAPESGRSELVAANGNSPEDVVLSYGLSPTWFQTTSLISDGSEGPETLWSDGAALLS